MKKEQVSKAKLPDSPGVYYFLGKHKKILYIGKATSLKSRVSSYFSADLSEKRSLLISKMVEETESLDFTATDSVLEALILETNLIRTHKPYYNTRSKDDKSYNFLIITKEEWPRVVIVRERDIAEKFLKEEILYKFGPFPYGSLFKEALKIIRKIFKYYDTKRAVGTEKSKIERGQVDFNRQIGLYPDENNKSEYLKTIRHLKLFFSGKKTVIIKELEKEMNFHAEHEEFEEANLCKKKIFALQHIEDIALIRNDYYQPTGNSPRIEAYDIAHLQGEAMVGVMVVVRGGESQKSEYRRFKVKSVIGSNDVASLREVLKRRLTHSEWPLPEIVVVDGNFVQKRVAESLLPNNIKVVAVTKDERHKPIKLLGDEDVLINHKFEILLANAEAHRFAIGFHRKLFRNKLLN